MVIGKVWDSEYPWDVRVEKVCDALTAAGHRVELVCRNRRGDVLEESRNGLGIHRMPPVKGASAAVDRLTSFPAFFNPRWRRHTLATFRRTGVELIVCRDLPLAPMASSVARQLSVPVILDIAEHYPGLLRDLYNRQDFRLINLAVRNPVLAGMVERRVLPRADAVWVVVQEMADRLVQMGVRAERISVVSNTPTLERADRMRRIPRSAGEPRLLRLVYHGNVERSRGLATVLHALHLMREDPLQVTFDVFGDGKSMEHDRQLCSALGLGEQVRFHGRHPYDRILDRLGEYDAGVIPHHATDHWNYTIQNKLFDYMAAGLPVVVSSMPPAARIVTESGTGCVFRDREPATLRQVLLSLGDPGLRARFGAAGRNAVSATYNWTLDANRLLESVTRTAGPSRINHPDHPRSAWSHPGHAV
jgi:glycosyltransferase involved in cell wall biosynthesis